MLNVVWGDAEYCKSGFGSEIRNGKIRSKLFDKRNTLDLKSLPRKHYDCCFT